MVKLDPMGKDMLREATARIRRKTALAATAGDAMRVAALGLCLVSGLILLLRRYASLETPVAALLPPAVLLAALPVGYLLARRRFIDEHTAAVWLDKKAGGSGRIAAQVEQGAGPWSADLESELAAGAAGPALRLKRPARMLGGALALAAAAVLVPMPRYAPSNTADRLHDAAVERLTQQLEVLEEALNDEELLAELEQDIAALEQGRGDGGESLEGRFEALDAVEQRMQAAASDLAERMKDALEAAAGAAPGGELPEALKEALAAAASGDSALANELAGNFQVPDPDAPGGMRPATADDLRDGAEGLQPKGADAMGDAMASLDQRWEQMKENMTAMGLMRPDMGDISDGDCTGDGQCDKPGHRPGHHPAEGNGEPGRGGITRGPGSAPLVWGREPPDLADRMNDATLNFERDPGKAPLTELGPLGFDPELDGRGESAGTSGVATSPGDETRNRRFTPEQRRALGAYFQAGTGE